jgi:hypothetical protein
MDEQATTTMPGNAALGDLVMPNEPRSHCESLSTTNLTQQVQNNHSPTMPI